MITRIRPRIPANRPASSELRPTCGEIDCTSCSVKFSGSWPYLRTLVSWFAWSWVNPFGDGPLIVNCPEVSAPWVSGADCTLPSRTIAVESSVASSWLVDAVGKYLLNWLVVSVPNALVASPLSVRLTTHCVLFCCRAGVTAVSCVPSKTAGPRTYLVPFGSHETVWFFNSSHWSPASVYPTLPFQLSSTVVGLGPGLHTSLSNSFLVPAFTKDASPVVTVAAALDGGVGVALALGVVLVLGVVLALADA